MSDPIATPNRSSSAFAAPWQSSLIRSLSVVATATWFCCCCWRSLQFGRCSSWACHFRPMEHCICCEWCCSTIISATACSIPLGTGTFHGPGISCFQLSTARWPTYLAELLHLIGLDFVARLIASFAVLIVFSGFGMYRLARDVLGIGIPGQRWWRRRPTCMRRIC